MKPSIWLIAILALTQTTSAFAQGGTYTDPANDFRITAPEGWAAAPMERHMVWHVASEGGTKMPDCGVIATADWSMTHLTPEEYIESQNEAQLKKALGLNFTDVVIGYWEPNFRLGGQSALHYVYSGTLDGLRQTSLGLQTVRAGKLYTFFCNAPSDKFSSSYADLLAIADSFAFLPTNTIEQTTSQEQVAPLSNTEQGTNMSSTLIQWTFILALIAFSPYTYWRITRYKGAHIALRLLSYCGVIVVGALVGVSLWAVKMIGMPWISFVVVMFCVAHYYGLRHVTKKAAVAAVGGRIEDA